MRIGVPAARPRRRRWLPWIASAVAAALMAQTVTPVAAQADPGRSGRVAAPSPGRVVAGRVVKALPRKSASLGNVAAVPAKVAWPAAGTAEVAVPEPHAALRRAGQLPVWVGAPDSQPQRSAGSAVAAAGEVRVRVLDRDTARRAGVDGLLLTVARSDGATAAGQARVRVDYSGFGQAFGGSFGTRLRLEQLPACAVTTPERAECRLGRLVSTANDGVAKTLTADVVAVSSGETLLAATAAPSGSSGDFKASSLSPSATWQVGTNTGSFNWSYPMDVPPVPGGLEPQVELSYSSSSVDGRTSNSNGQPSWVGEGFDLWPGYIERSYKPCSDDGAPQNNGIDPGDQCWAYDNATITWGGRGGELVLANASTNTWRLADDDGTRIQKLTGAVNGDNDGEYWKVTDTDGTQYFFGSNLRLPGWASGKPEANSAWTVPVFGNNEGEPCHSSTGFSASSCIQAWRWNLDYIVDAKQNAVTYYYKTETNKYAQNVSLTNDVSYVRGGYLDHVDYGLRSTNLFPAKAPAQVAFGVSERCIRSTASDCAESNITSHPDYWWDVPWDLNCTSGCALKGLISPTFWSRKRLTKVTTRVLNSDGITYKDVQSFDLTHDWRLADIDRDLVLHTVSQTGDPNGSPASLPPLTFLYEDMFNRVDKLYDDIPPFIRARLTAVNDEYGGIVDVNYSPEDCAPGDLPTPETNTRRCYPVYWQPAGHDNPIRDWFHKYVVTQVVQTDRTGGAPDMVTNYSYQGGAAWHFDDDDGLTKEKYKTWSQWRGYGSLSVTSGGWNDMRSQTDRFFFRGMDDDRFNTSGGTKSVTISDGEGGSYPDHDSLQGMEYRSVTYDRPGGSVVGKTVNAPWHVQTASRTRPWGTVTANLADVRIARSFTALSSGGWRETKTTTEHDTTTGLPTKVEDLGNVATATDDRCTNTSYAQNTAAWLMDYPSQKRTVALSCSATPTDLATQLIADELSYYDNAAFGAAPSRGEATRVEEAASASGTTVSYVTESLHSYDSYGRVKTSTDAGGNTTTTTYTDTAGLNTGVSMQSPQVLIGGVPTSLTTSQVIDVGFGSPKSKTDAGGKTTNLKYDGLGRLTDVWLPNRATTATPNIEYTYRVVDGQPVSVGTRSLTASGGQSTSYVLYDGLLRARQTQSEGPTSQGIPGRLITDTFYDTRGKVSRSYDTYYASGAPSTSLFGVATPGDVETQNAYEYDGLGRVTVERLLAGSGDGAEEKWRTTTSYGGDRVTVDPPAGGTPITTINDARGRTVELRQYQGADPTGAYDSTTYDYTPAGDLKTINGPGGLTWTYRYDLRRRKLQDVDPDKGLTKSTYDDLGQVTLVEDARGKKLAYTYDPLGRKTGEFDTSTAGPKLAEWTYDTARKGQPASATRYADGDPYTVSYSLYDNLNRPLKTTYSIPSVNGEQTLAGTYEFGATYNLDDTVQAILYPAGGGLPQEKLTPKYDADDLQRPVQLTSDLSSTTYVAGTNYSFDGKPQQYTLSGGGKPVYLTYKYESGTQRLAEFRAERQDIPGVDRDAFYSYDQAGNVTQVKDISRAGTDNQCFRYDYLRRLTQAWAQGTATCVTDPTTALGGPAPYWQSFTYDPTGNRKTETHHNTNGTVSAARTYTYGTGHQLSRVDQTGGDAHTESYGYDPAGNTSSRTIGSIGQTLTWDVEGALTKISDSGTGDTSFVYDADGHRLLRRDRNGTTLYLDNMELRLNKATGAVTGTRYYEHNGQTVAMRNPSGVQLLATDNHGTAEEAIDATTQTMTLRRFTPFGQARGSVVGTWPDEKGFVGGTVDATTGLTHLGAREYDPNTGRFISVDPIIDPKDPQQLNAYAYANNTPMTMSDPDGQKPVGDNIHDEWSYNDYKRTGRGSRPGADYDYGDRDSPGHGPSGSPANRGRNWRVDTSRPYIPPAHPCKWYCQVGRAIKKGASSYYSRVKTGGLRAINSRWWNWLGAGVGLCAMVVKYCAVAGAFMSSMEVNIYLANGQRDQAVRSGVAFLSSVAVGGTGIWMGRTSRTLGEARTAHALGRLARPSETLHLQAVAAHAVTSSLDFAISIGSLGGNLLNGIGYRS